MEKCRSNLQSQFDQWYNNVTSREEIFYGDGERDKHTSAYVGGGTSKSAAGPSGKVRSSGGNSNSNKSSSSHETGPSGNNANYVTTEVNEDIQAFYAAKDQLLKRREQEEIKRKAADR